MDNTFYSQFRSTDIIVWNHIITTFDVVKELIGEEDEIQFADDEERKSYLELKNDNRNCSNTL